MASEKKTISKKNVKTPKKTVKPKVVSYVPNLRKHYLDNMEILVKK